MFKMTKEEKIAILEEALDLDKNTLTPETVLADLEEWDSLAALSLIVLMDEKCGKKLTGKEAKAFVTVQDILNFIG